VDSICGDDGYFSLEYKNAMTEDLKRAGYFALNPNIIVPCDDEDLPLSVDTEGDKVFWVAFESPELGQQSSALDPSAYKWGQIQGLQMLKFLLERVEAGGEHFFIVNPGTNRQMGMNNQSVKDFLTWLDNNPQGLEQL
jgi:hypothetical protein